MKILILLTVITLLIMASPSQSDDKINQSAFEVITLNNPVRDPDARLLFKIHHNLKVDKISYAVIGPKLINAKMGDTKVAKLTDTPQGPELIISVKNWQNGFYKIFIKVFDKNDKIHEYKSAQRNYISFSVFDPKKSVPQPDLKKNDSSLLGIDIDNNGIRDDIQNYIVKTYETNIEAILAANQYALGFQSEMEFYHNKDLAIQAAHLARKGLECMIYTLQSQGMNINKSIIETEKIEALYINTKERVNAARKISEHFHGQSGSSQSKEEACSI